MNIAFVSDYFYPSTGGIETHIKAIGEEMVKLGNKVFIITHKYIYNGEVYQGVRKIGNLTVYYLDFPIVACNTTLPLIFGGFSIYYAIFKRHNIEIVHGHQSMSSMCIEALFHANFLNIKTVLTDHSMFETDKFERILVDNIMEFICRYVDRGICVSEISKINTQIRTKLPFEKLTVIPNGFDSKIFYPGKRCKLKNKNTINLVICSRLVYRKGIDLLIEAIPYICQDKTIKINIVGDGIKKDEIQQVIDENNLNNQVFLLGDRSHKEIGDIYRENDILLNTSFTETFCMVIVEASVCGLSIVTTNVGGISELKGINNMLFCEQTGKDVAEKVFEAAEIARKTINSPNISVLSKEYSWKLIAEKTLKVYLDIPKKEFYPKIIEKDYPGFRNIFYRICARIEMWQIWISEKFNTF